MTISVKMSSQYSFPSVACLLGLLAVVFGEQKLSSELQLLGHFFHVLNLQSCKEPRLITVSPATLCIFVILLFDFMPRVCFSFCEDCQLHV